MSLSSYNFTTLHLETILKIKKKHKLTKKRVKSVPVDFFPQDKECYFTHLTLNGVDAVLKFVNRKNKLKFNIFGQLVNSQKY